MILNASRISGSGVLPYIIMYICTFSHADHTRATAMIRKRPSSACPPKYHKRKVTIDEPGISTLACIAARTRAKKALRDMVNGYCLGDIKVSECKLVRIKP